MTTLAKKPAPKKKRKNPAKIVTKRPAEVAAPVAMAVAMLIGSLVDLDTAQISYLAVIVAFVPAAVTWIVELVRG